MENKEYFIKLEESLKERLLGKAHLFGMAPSGGALIVEELEEYWKRDAPEFMQYAVKEFNSYPTSTLAWAAYMGMAYAMYWDANPGVLSDKNLFSDMVASRGWDEMDEYIVQELLGLDLKGESVLSERMLSLAQDTDSLLRRESVEPGTPAAFYALSSALKVMFIVGITIELHSLGYSYHKIEVPLS